MPVIRTTSQGLAFAALLSLSACGSGESSGAGGASTGSRGSTGQAGGGVAVTFTYRPQWKGVTEVNVIGGFGRAADWDPKMPFLKLQDDGTGTWTGKANLPDGEYLYLYQVLGDADGLPGAKRYAVDSGVSDFLSCPMESPTWSAEDVNPCSRITVPQFEPETTAHVKGTVLYGGAPIQDYLVQIEREEDQFHHFFANRTNSAADGSFDLEIVPGHYRVYVLHPTYLTKDDVARDPLALKAFRRALSSIIVVVGDTTKVEPVDMEYADYDKLMPTGTTSLPTTFDFTLLPSASSARVSVYGTANSGANGTVYDSWFNSTYGKTTSVIFDGMFNTMPAGEVKVVPGERYFWGTWQLRPAGAGGTWTGQSMVFPITWN